MRNLDFSPFYGSTVGFERLLDQAMRIEPTTNWPPYNIEKAGDDRYRITMAVAGFSPEEIELTQHGNSLTVTGRKQGESESGHLLHRGIATRPFKQTFNLADHVKVSRASLDNGLLTVDLVREVPDELKPRRIELAADSERKAPSQDNAPWIEDEARSSQAA